ncbi:MAG: oligosaccharide repeat unit polymerase [Ignavibacteria bacterium]|nr:oligosaccharide repeat unit polymerase [Ignavibacteria bacterium]
MSVIIIAVAACLSILLGRWLFQAWFNHIALYAVVWATSLILFEIRLILYYPLEPETWFIIGGAWIAFVLGSATIPAGRFALGFKDQKHFRTLSPENPHNKERELHILNMTLWVVNVVIVLDVLHQLYLVTKLVGGLLNVLILGNALYSFRVSEAIPGSIPYLGSLSLTATLLAGAYTGLIERIRIVAVIPLIVVILSAIANMGRASLLIAALLFMTGYVLNRQRLTSHHALSKSIRWKRVMSLVCAVLLLVVGAEIIRSNRGTTEGFSGATTSLRKLSGGSFVTPSVYLYATVHPGVLNQYLKVQDERLFFGGNTFAPFWRLLSKFGFDTYVPEYLPFYKTPVGSNTGTYLRELHADFGVTGVLLYPFILGLVSSAIWFRLRRSSPYLHLGILAHMYVLVGMSIIVQATRLGYWLTSLLGAFVMGMLIDHFINSKQLSRGFQSETNKRE